MPRRKKNYSITRDLLRPFDMLKTERAKKMNYKERVALRNRMTSANSSPLSAKRKRELADFVASAKDAPGSSKAALKKRQEADKQKNSEKGGGKVPRRRTTANGGVVEDLSKRDIQNIYGGMRREGRERGNDVSAISNKNLQKRSSSGGKVS